LNSGDSQLANSKAISECAYVPPPFPDLDIIPIAFVSFIHFCGDILNLLLPDSFLKVSNSTRLKFGLLTISHKA